MLAVALRVIELQFRSGSITMPNNILAGQRDLYRSYYDRRKFMRPARDIMDAIGFAEIFPEYLFPFGYLKRKILTDEMIVNHLDRIPVMMAKLCPYPESGGTVRPILIGLPKGGKEWSYSTKLAPMVSDSFALNYRNHGMDGIYYNGASWMRIEICGYVTGQRRGWSGAQEGVANRLWAELMFRTSRPARNTLATDSAHAFFGYHRVFAWNSFILQGLELAALQDLKWILTMLEITQVDPILIGVPPTLNLVTPFQLWFIDPGESQ